MASPPSTNQIYAILDQVMDPELNHSLVELGMIREVDFDAGCVQIELQLTTPHCPFAGEIEHRIRSALLEMDSVDEVSINRPCAGDA
ncbi:MAG: iron-sulfur cluster assembly protein [Thiohalobacteraceae bacterium]